MMATGSLGPLYTDRRAGEGNLPRLMPCLQVSHAPDNAVAELSNTLKSSRAVVSPTLPPRHLGREQSRSCSRPFHILHADCPRVLGSLCGGKNTGTERFSCLKKSFAKQASGK